jgi:hypothetical protein
VVSGGLQAAVFVCARHGPGERGPLLFRESDGVAASRRSSRESDALLSDGGTLRCFNDAPQLPCGYATMIALANVRPLWFRVMNPGVLAHDRDDIAQSNIRPASCELALIAGSGPKKSRP